MGVFYIKPALVIEPAYMPAEPDGFNDGELEVLLLVGLVLLTVVGEDIMFGGGAVFFAAASLSVIRLVFAILSAGELRRIVAVSRSGLPTSSISH